VRRSRPFSERAAARAGAGAHPPRTKWTRRVPHPVLIGHAASPSQARVLFEQMRGSERGRAAAERLVQVGDLLSAALPPGSSLEAARISFVLRPTLELPRYAGGLMVQAVISAPKQRPDAVAVGGRYDPLVAGMAADGGAAAIGAVGVCFSVERLALLSPTASALASAAAGSAGDAALGDWGPLAPVCSARVCARRGAVGPDAVLRVCGALWQAGVLAMPVLGADDQSEQAPHPRLRPRVGTAGF
jgi:hypothetical protein